jgi:UPF0755 protein
MSNSGAGWSQGGDDGHYFDHGDHEWSEPSGGSQGDQYGQGPGRRSGRHSAPSWHASDGSDGSYWQGGGQGGAGYAGPGFGQDAYAQGWSAGGGYPGDEPGRDHFDPEPGRGWYGQPAASGSYDESRYGPDGGGRDGYGHDGYGSAGPDGAGYVHGGYGRGSYGQEQYGQEQYGQEQYGQEHYGQDAFGQNAGQAGYGDYYGQAPYRGDGYGSGRHGQDPLGGGSYGHDRYAPDGYGPADGYGSPAGHGPGYDYGSPGRSGWSDPGSDAGADATSGYRSAGGSSDGQDSGWFDHPDTGSFGIDDGYHRDGQASYGLPAGTVRRAELSGPATSRSEDGNSPPGMNTPSAHAGYDQWHDSSDDAGSWRGDEPAEPEDVWQDDHADAGLLSSRFNGGGATTGRRAGRVRRQRRVRGKFAFTAAILAGALVLGAVADFGYERFKAWHTARYGDYPGSGYGQVRFSVPENAALSALGPALLHDGVIMELRPYDSAAAAAPNASHLQPGIYLLHHHMKSSIVVNWLLSSAHRINDQITLIEGLRAVQIAHLLAKQSGLPVSQFTQIIDHPPAALGLPSWAAGKTAEGFLFPDTYTLAPKMTALQILQMMVSEFKHQIASIDLVAAAHKVFTTPWHVLIVASLVQAEAGSVSDFGKISRVVWHRLQDGMKLQLDSTVFYAMGTYGTYVKTQAQKNFPSPYNTYLHAGLPPGPIGNPGIAAIQAAVHPPHGNWLYFITDTRHKPYKTYFTASFSQFQQWQREFQG